MGKELEDEKYHEFSKLITDKEKAKKFAEKRKKLLDCKLDEYGREK